MKIPAEHTADGKNNRRPWHDRAPAATAAALIMDDPVPMPQPFVHWVIQDSATATCRVMPAAPSGHRRCRRGSGTDRIRRLPGQRTAGRARLP
jgi:phosphatidylethanolamine-binding protein (PEBP) family uncharacterized protein